MARKTEITLGQVEFFVRKESQQEVDANGQPLFGQSGLPRMLDVWVLDVIQRRGPLDVEIIHILFDEEGKENLVEALTGGVVVVSAAAMPGR